MISIRYVKNTDKSFWFSLDKHISKETLNQKIRDKQGYILMENDIPIALLRYNLFWDNIPFCTMLFVDWQYQQKGYGKMIMDFWEKDMKKMGYEMVMTSTRVDEDAKHFYRKLVIKKLVD